jgi:hypothetical protein
MYYILLALTEECCGVDIMERVKTISHGRVTVGPGTLYAMLAKFEERVSYAPPYSQPAESLISSQMMAARSWKRNTPG